MESNLEKGDTVALRDGRSVEVLKVLPDYEKPGGFIRFDYVDHSEASPMRRTAYPSELLRIVRKTVKKTLDPFAVRPNDDPKPSPIPVSIVNQEAGPQVHAAVKAPAKPVLKRGKTDKEINAENKKG